MTIMDICKKHEKFIKEALEDMRNVEMCKTFPKLRSTYTVHYAYIVLIKFKTMILDSVICIGNRIPLSEYECIDESLSNIDRSELNVAGDEWMSVLATHIPGSLQDGIRNIWENNTTVRKWVETSVLDMIYPYLSKDEKEALVKLYSKYRKILSGESFYDLIEEKRSC